MLSPPSNCWVLSSPELVQWGRRADVAGLHSYYVFNSSHNTKITQGQHQTWQVSLLATSKVRVCTLCICMKRTHTTQKKKKTICLKMGKKKKKKMISFRDLTCTQQIWGKELKRESCGWYPPQLTPIPPLPGSTSHLAESSSWSATGFLLLCQMG